MALGTYAWLQILGHYLVIVPPWANSSPSVGLSFLHHKVGLINKVTSIPRLPEGPNEIYMHRTEDSTRRVLTHRACRVLTVLDVGQSGLSSFGQSLLCNSSPVTEHVCVSCLYHLVVCPRLVCRAVFRILSLLFVNLLFNPS